MAEKAVFRRALPADRERVMAIHQNVYEGGDYIPAFYNMYMQNPDIHCYVAEIDGKLVAFVAKLILEQGTAVLHGAGRTSEDFQNQGLISNLGDYGTKEVMKIYPYLTHGFSVDNVKKIADRVMNDPNSSKKLLQTMHFLHYKTNHENVKTLSKHPSSTKTALQLMPIQMDSFYQDGHIGKKVFPGGVVSTYPNWVLYSPTPFNLKIISQGSHTLYTIGENNSIVAMSFGSLCLTKKFSFRYDITYYHDKERLKTEQDKVEYCLAHMIAHAKHIVQISNTDSRIGLYIRLQYDINVDKVKTVLSHYIGANVRSNYFKHDFAFFYKSKLPTAKL